MVTTLRELVLSGVTTGTSAEFDIGGADLKNVEVYAEWSAGVTAGTVMLESAARKGASAGGFWMNEGTDAFRGPVIPPEGNGLLCFPFLNRHRCQ